MTDLLGPASALNATTVRPADARVFGNDDTFFKGCSAPDVDDGTEIGGDFLNGILQQVRRAIRGMGVTVNNADDDMLLKAIRAQGIPYLVDSGAANAMVVTSAGNAITSYAAPCVMLVKAANDVTGATTINRDIVGAKNVVHPDGTALARGDWPAGGIGLVAYDGTQFQLLTVVYSQQAQQFGQCYLALSGGNLLLARKDGRYLFINGAFRPIPAAGVTLAPTGLTSNTLYYIYAAWTAGAVVLEASTTGHVTDTVTGAEVKNGDVTRTLVGQAYVTTGPAFSDADGAVHVLSWFNRKRKRSRTAFTSNHSTTSSTPSEIGSEIRNSFICWADEPVSFVTAGSAAATGGQVVMTSIGFDGITPEPEVVASGNGTGGATDSGPLSLFGEKSGLAEGKHYATLIGARASGAGTATWYGVTDYTGGAAVASLTITVRG